MLNKTGNIREILNYMITPLSQNSLNVLYSAHNIKLERCQLFSDFTQSLICKIMNTYMGDGYTTPEQRIEHFEWCWNANVGDFADEGINLKESPELYFYFQEWMLESFYTSNEKGDMEDTKRILIKLWKYILSYTTNKTRSDVDMFIDVYQLFEKTL